MATNYIPLSAGQSNKESTVNDALFNLSPAAIFGINTTQTAGLSVCLFGGKLADGIKFDDLIYITLTANSTNYVEANAVTKTVTVNTTGFTGGGVIQLWKFITNANSITNQNTADERAQTLFTADSSIVNATDTVAGLVKTSQTVFLDANNKLDVAIDDVTIKKDENGKLYALVSGGGSGTGDGLTYLEEVKTGSSLGLTPKASNTEQTLHILFVPKGYGGFIVSPQKPDNSALGGGVRGYYAVDIQTYRTAATQVASQYAVAIGSSNNPSDFAVTIGTKNIADGYSSGYGGIAIGQENTASGNTGGVAIGYKCTASGSPSFACGKSSTASGGNAVAIGTNNTSSGNNAVVIGGSRNAASGNSSFVFGNGATDNGIARSQVFYGGTSLGQTTTTGALQIRKLPYYATITSASALTKQMNSYGTTYTLVDAATQLTLQNNQVKYFEGTFAMIENTTLTSAVFHVKGLIKRFTNAASTVLTTSSITTEYADQAAIDQGWSMTLSANTTLGSLTVQCDATTYNSKAVTCFGEFHKIIEVTP